jgi:hypothetical protein
MLVSRALALFTLLAILKVLLVVSLEKDVFGAHSRIMRSNQNWLDWVHFSLCVTLVTGFFAFLGFRARA